MNCSKCNRVIKTNNGFWRIDDLPHCKKCSEKELSNDFNDFVLDRMKLIKMTSSEPCFEKSGKYVVLALHKCIQCIKFIIENNDKMFDETINFINMVSVRAEDKLYDEKHRERLYKVIVEGLLTQIKTLKRFKKDFMLIQSFEEY